MPEPTKPPARRHLHLLYWVVSLATAAVLLYYSLRGIEWNQVWIVVRSARPAGVALALVLMSVVLFVRAYRWRVLLTAETPVPMPLAFWATAAGYLGNNVLPMRAGELIRTVMISRRLHIGKTFVLTTALSERMVDAIALITISASVLLTMPERPGWLAKAAMPFAILGLLGVAAIALLPALEPFWFRCLAMIPIPAGPRTHIENTLRQILEGVRSFHDAGRLTRFLLLTAVVWCLDGLTTVVGAQAIGVPITFPMAFLLVAGLGLGSALPSTPGYVGIYQFVAVSILTPFGLSRTDAIAYILMFQAMNYIVVLVWGLLGLERQRKFAAAKPVLIAP